MFEIDEEHAFLFDRQPTGLEDNHSKKPRVSRLQDQLHAVHDSRTNVHFSLTDDNRTILASLLSAGNDEFSMDEEQSFGEIEALRTHITKLQHWETLIGKHTIWF